MRKVTYTESFKSLVLMVVFICVIYILITTKRDFIRTKNGLIATNLKSTLSKGVQSNESYNNMSDVKIILLWTTYYGRDSYLTPPFEPCEYKFVHTNDRSYLPNASLVVFHVGETKAADLPLNSSVPKVYLAIESAVHAIFYRGSPPADFYNYSITYRDDSDVTLIYDPPRTEYSRKTDKEIEKIIAKKTEFALSARSNCRTPSKRERLIEQLQSYVNLTLVGGCSKVDCDNTCLDKLIENHYFYLSFENSICDQYTTEKFFRFTKFIVPIVLKRSVVPKRIPHDIFIAVDDFNNVIELVNYLKMLVRTPKEYKKYFEWAKHDPLTDTYSKKVLDAACTSCKLAHELPPKQIPDYSKILDRDLCDNDFLNRFLNTTSSSAI
ncbi:unnamed protein product [Bursaphelenchus okinawaensis]|uniref:Fucosyltransferase n=1 Tax=Bursaphelenchus okinawaensis TaxID=465554 RepID=A0A811K517_9BILA|nr:unnamed protein product [Bursaphelenchus okinawaensis]CAG9090844.1 unnamed protein product [Bursaphelenchus okinawaensis]